MSTGYRPDEAGPNTTQSVTREDVEAAYERIRRDVRMTPVIDVDSEDFDPSLGGNALMLKLEFLQHTGSFKPRGAFNNLRQRARAGQPVAAASGGNHGAAVAFAAARLGLAARIFVPSVAPKAKLDVIRDSGAELVIAGERYADALAACEAYQAESGAIALHAFDQAETLAGQGTVALEAAGQAEFDTMLVSVGGGGLIGGMAAHFRGARKLVAVEPRLAPTLHDALAAGRPVDAPTGGIAADSLAPRQIGQLAFPLARDFVDRAVLVEDEDITAAQRALWSRLKIVTEPGGATAFAALLSGAYRPEPGERVCVLLCGANAAGVECPASVP